jgi:hypothetical protein
MVTARVAAVLAVAETTTTMVPRVVGEPLPSWVVVGAGLAVLALIVVAGLVARRRS